MLGEFNKHQMWLQGVNAGAHHAAAAGDGAAAAERADPGEGRAVQATVGRAAAERAAAAELRTLATEHQRQTLATGHQQPSSSWPSSGRAAERSDPGEGCRPHSLHILKAKIKLTEATLKLVAEANVAAEQYDQQLAKLREAWRRAV